MRAAYIKKKGAPDVIEFGELPTPKPAATQVLVKVGAVAVDPIDTYIRSGAYPIDLQFPFIVGRDLVGEVAEVGSAVRGFAVGDAVWCNNQGYGGRQGTFSEFVVVDESMLYPLPPGTDPLHAVASVHSALTAFRALQLATPAPGETVFINGGSGNVGLCAIQAMKMPGINLRVVVTAGSEDKAKRCSEAGADKVILYKKENVSDELRKFAPHGVNVYWDLTKQPDVPLAVDTCAKRGRILLSAGLTHRSELEVGKFYTKNLRMHGFTITDLSPIELQELSVGIITAFAHKALRPHIAEQLPLSETARAHALVESGIDGKVVLTP